MQSLVSRYGERLGVRPVEPVVTLGEGQTPLLPSVALGPSWGLRRLYFKGDHLNPTGSYKDRFSVFHINAMRAAGQTVCLATSSGNAGSSLAAYAARAGIRVILAINEVTPAGKLSQMAAHGAELVRVLGFGRDAETTDFVWRRLRELAEAHGAAFMVTAFKYCPGPMRGVGTMSYEIVEQLGEPPEVCFVPVGGGGLYSAMTLGFADLGAQVRMEPVQPGGNDTIITPLHAGEERARPVLGGRGSTISGLSVPVDIDGTLAMRHARATHGRGYLVDEDSIREIQAELYLREGLSVEPAGAVSVAGVKAAVDAGELDPDSLVVAVLTGQGFKDPDRERNIASRMPLREVQAEELSDDLFTATEAGR